MTANLPEAERIALLDLCRSLVEAPSINPPGRTGPCINIVQAFLAARGLPAEMVAVDPEKHNLVATVAGRGPGPHLVLNGHVDTVRPGDEAAWTVPLHALTRRDGRLYGHGIGNMKAGTAALVHAYAALAMAPSGWRGRLTLTVVADETVFGPAGSAHLLATRPELAGDALLCAEGPGGMGLAIAEKGLLWLALEASAVPGQGMLALRGSGAIARLAPLLTKLDGWNARFADPPTDLPGLVPGADGLRLSVNTGTIRGGTFVSQAAHEAVAELDLRVPPGMDADLLEREVEALVAARPGLAVRRIKGWQPNATAPDALIVRAVVQAALAVRRSAPALVVRLPASDASRWRALGVPAVCYGPQPTPASGVDDYVLEQDLNDCALIYAAAARSFLA